MTDSKGLKGKIKELEKEHLELPLNVTYGSKADTDKLINLGKRIALKETVEMIEGKITELKIEMIPFKRVYRDDLIRVCEAKIQALEELL